MARRSKHLLGLYLNISLWLVAVLLTGLAVGSSAVTDAHSARIGDEPGSRPGDPPSGPAAPSRSTVRLYDVHDLVDRWLSSPFEVTWHEDTWSLNLTSNNLPQERVRSTPKNEIMEEIGKLISDSVRPEDWASNGGSAAVISHMDRTLIISGDASLHRAVAGVLQALRDADGNSPISLKK